MTPSSHRFKYSITCLMQRNTLFTDWTVAKTSNDPLSWQFRRLHDNPCHDNRFTINTYTSSYHKSTPSLAVPCTIIYNWGVVWRGNCCVSTPISGGRTCAPGLWPLLRLNSLNESTWIRCDGVKTHCTHPLTQVPASLYGNRWCKMLLLTPGVRSQKYVVFVLSYYFSWWLFPT